MIDSITKSNRKGRLRIRIQSSCFFQRRRIESVVELATLAKVERGRLRKEGQYRFFICAREEIVPLDVVIMILFCSEQGVCEIFFLTKEFTILGLFFPGTRQNAIPTGAASETKVRTGTTEKGV